MAWFLVGLSRRSVVSLRGFSASVGCSIRHLKQKAIILDEKDEPPAKRKKNDLSPPSEED